MILLALGSNLAGANGSPLVACEAAVLAVERVMGGPAVRSRWFATAPVPASDQPDYINGVIGFPDDPAWEPATLLRALQGIEAAWGRVRTVANAARELDLDILAMGPLRRAAPDPVLPHPRLHERRFVLEPLGDVDPGFRHPVTGEGLAAMLASLPPGGVRLAPESGG